MELRSITQAQVADFINNHEPWSGSFLQFPWCLNLELAYDHKVEYLGCYDDNKLIALCSTVLYKLPQNLQYAYCVRGPVVIDKKYVELVLKLLVERYKKHTLFLRVEPIVLSLEFSRQVGQGIIKNNVLPNTVLFKGFIKSRDIQPRTTLMTDLTQSEDDLLKTMHQKTRYNIRLAERKGLKFRWGGADDFPLFWNCLKDTADRGKFRTHHIHYYHELLKGMDARLSLAHRVEAKIGLVEYEGEVLAACLQMIGFGNITYLHGGSIRHHSELMAPYLMHWRVMQEAKKIGCRVYDWWGIQPSDGSHSEWAGFTKFKLGFSGKRIEYIGTFDKPFSWPTYILYKVGRLVNLLWLEILGHIRRQVKNI